MNTREGFTKHKDLILQWLKGADIEYYKEYTQSWHPAQTPCWDKDTRYRVLLPKLENVKMWYKEDSAVGAAFLRYSPTDDKSFYETAGWRLIVMSENKN